MERLAQMLSSVVVVAAAAIYVIAVVVLIFKTVPISPQYLLVSVLIDLTVADACRGGRLTNIPRVWYTGIQTIYIFFSSGTHRTSSTSSTKANGNDNDGNGGDDNDRNLAAER